MQYVHGRTNTVADESTFECSYAFTNKITHTLTVEGTVFGSHSRTD
jgi:hypothetical protein